MKRSTVLVKPVSITSKPGVYIFLRRRLPLYIGKAANLKKRVFSYFRKNIGAKITDLLQESTSLKFIETDSEMAALIKEAELIKKYQPKYNYLLRDDKNYFYVEITKERFPRIFLTHQPTKTQKAKSKRQNDKSKLKNIYIGPFTSGVALKTTLKLLRRIFPYCTCKTTHGRACLNSQIGGCPGFCCRKNQSPLTDPKLQNQYLSDVRKIVAVMSGKKRGLMTELKKNMRTEAKNQNFEKAAKIRNEIQGLENIFSHRPVHNYKGLTSIVNWKKIERTLKTLTGSKRNISRVEGYDVSNILGKEATGSMVVFVDGFPAKSAYRKFRIKTVRQINDIEMLKEVIGRRLNHPEWPYPDLILVDGGKTQFNAAVTALKFSIFKIRLLGEFTGIARRKQRHLLPTQFSKPSVAALAKREEELYLENRRYPVKLNNLPQHTAFFLQRVRDESHRFARKYHHKLREISFRVR